MKLKTNKLDDFLYVLMCLCSLGAVWLIRIVITKAIQETFKD